MNLEDYEYEPYCFHDEITELLTLEDGRICGFEVSEQMEDFFKSYGDAIIAFAKRCKKKHDEKNNKDNENQGSLF